MKKLIVARRISQAFFLALFIYILWSTTYPLKGLLPPGTFFATNPHIIILTAISQRVVLPGLLFAALMLILTFVLGRFYCGWVCPLGTLIDLAGAFRKKRKVAGDAVNSFLRKPKFFFLAAGTMAAFLGIQIAWILDPMVIVARFVSLNLIPAATLLTEKTLIFLMKDLGLQDALYAHYQALKSSFLGVKTAYFPNSPVIFAFFALICLASLALTRMWCRMICPLGALYALTAKTALLKRRVSDCVKCGRCRSFCRTGAIREDMSYSQGECILCMDCIYTCPGKHTRFSFGAEAKKSDAKGMSRGQFLLLLISSFAVFFSRGAVVFGAGKSDRDLIIRPPASLKEEDFLDRCIRCGNCMKVCPTNGLQPIVLEAGLAAIWTPRLVPEIGYCEYNCTLCGSVCPTKAIKKLSLAEKHMTKLGTAVVDRSKCIAWAENKQCLVCEEHCPVSSKAIKADRTMIGDTPVGRPVVQAEICVGCGICQTKCPVRPERAIKVNAEGAYRP